MLMFHGAAMLVRPGCLPPLTGPSFHVSQFCLALGAECQKQHLTKVQTFACSSTWLSVPELLTNSSNSTCLSLNTLSTIWYFYPSNDPSQLPFEQLQRLPLYPWHWVDCQVLLILLPYMAQWYLPILLHHLIFQLCSSPIVFPYSLLIALRVLSSSDLTLSSQAFKTTDTKSGHASLCWNSSPEASEMTIW